MNPDNNYRVNMEEIETKMIIDQKKCLLFAVLYLLNDLVL